MKIRDLHHAIQRGDLSVISEVADVLGELADVIGWLENADLLEQQEVVEHIKNLDSNSHDSSKINLSLISVSDCF